MTWSAERAGMGIPARSFRGRAGCGRACLAIRGEKGAEIPPLVLCYAAGAAGVRGKIRSPTCFLRGVVV